MMRKKKDPLLEETGVRTAFRVRRSILDCDQYLVGRAIPQVQRGCPMR
jgi:hypothetical protein